MNSIAYFISSHGYGHAARASAVMAALQELEPELRFEIFTQVPEWFFHNSLRGPFGYHWQLTDIGLAQKNSLVEDIPATVQHLQAFLPFDPAHLDHLAGQLRQLNCGLIMCDIAPLGIAVGQAAGLPAILVENFTWDWIYQGYLSQDKRLAGPITYLEQVFAAATARIQTEPVCRPLAGADLTVPPIGRRVRTPSAQIRERLGLPPEARVVLITMGGVDWEYTFLEQLQAQTGVYFLVPNGSGQVEHHDNLILFPGDSDYYHPDLINAADLVIGKAGYSTIAELYQAGVPFGYVARSRFRESPILIDYVQHHMSGLEIAEAEFASGRWLAKLPAMLALPRLDRKEAAGAPQVARFVLELERSLSP